MLNRAPALTPWCHAPSSALYFDPLGYVFPCCAGREPIGRIGGENGGTLREIWHGAALAGVREAVAVGDLSRGCSECELSANSSGREAALAVHFDRWHDNPDQVPLDIEFALSNACNLQCLMCNGMLSSAIRAHRDHDPPLPQVYGDLFFQELAEILPRVRRIAFKGGEPFLASEARRVMDLLLEQGTIPEIKITTNATVWSDRVERYLRDLRMEPIVSVDARDPAVLEAVRVGVKADQLWANVDHIERVAREVGRSLTFSYCIMPKTWQELAPLLAEAESRGAYVTAAHVHQPLSESLLSLQADELMRIRSQMDEQGSVLRSLCTENQATWDQALAWVEFCLERNQNGPNAGVPVMLNRSESE